MILDDRTEIKPITVAQLIAHLRKLPQDLPVVYNKYSEHKLLELEELVVKRLQASRPDGWVHYDWRKKEDNTVPYLVFPGN